MADGSVATDTDIEEQLTCAVCHERFEDPRSLPCSHYYCKRCVQALVDQASPHQSFLCPECRAETLLLQNDPNQLPNTLSITRMMEIHKPTAGSRGPKKCTKHRDALKLYCECCSCLVCGQCAAFDHHSHTCKPIDEVTPPLRELLQNKVASLKSTRQSYSDALAESRATISDVEAETIKTTSAIDQWVESYVEAIRTCGRDFVEHIKSSSQQKIDALNFQIKKEFESTSDVFEILEQSCEKLLQIPANEDFLENYKQVLDRADEVCAKHKGANFKPDPDCSKIIWTENLAQRCQKMAPVANKVVLAAASPPLMVGKRAKVSVALIAADETRVRQEQSVKGELKSLVDGSPIPVQVARKKDGSYEMLFTPNIRGGHQLAVKVNERTVAGSPFAIHVQIPPTQLGTPVIQKVITGLELPYGIAFRSDGGILVTVTRNIQLLDSHTKRIKRSFQNIRTSQALVDPKGLAVDRDDNVFVADCNKNCVYKLDKYGNQATAIGRRGFGRGEFNSPAGVSVVGEHVFICDTDNHRIQILDRDLAFKKSFGSRGTGQGQFEYVYDLCQDEAGNVYVCDWGNDRIQVLNDGGGFLYSFGSKGKGKGQLSGPAGVCVSGQYVYVSELGNDRISVFDKKGHFVATFGSEGSAPGCFKSPTIVRVDSDGFVYVSDNGNNRVQVF